MTDHCCNENGRQSVGDLLTDYYCVKHRKFIGHKRAARYCMHNKRTGGWCPNLGERNNPFADFSLLLFAVFGGVSSLALCYKKQ